MSTNNFITLNGMPGSGKSTITKLFEESNYEIVTIGNIQNELVRKLQITDSDFDKLMNSNIQERKRYDKLINRLITEKANKLEGKKVVFNTRASFKLIQDAVHVLLKVDEEVAINRIINKDKISYPVAKEKLLKDTHKEDLRLNTQIQANYLNEVHYNLVIDTSNLTPEEVKKIIEYKASEIWMKRSMELFNRGVLLRRN